jgi:nitrite reductase (NADH) small subunit
MKHVICKVEDLKPGEKRSISIGNRVLVLVRTPDGNYYALRNICPHRGADLSKGPIEGIVSSSAVREYCYGRQGEMIRCPWHGFEYDVKTGQNLVDKKLLIKSYTVKVEDDHVVVDI